MPHWAPIEDAPVGELIDVWLWDVVGRATPKTGRRVTGVKLIDKLLPPSIEVFEEDDGYWRAYNPDQNGEWLSHWMPCPEAPTID